MKFKRKLDLSEYGEGLEGSYLIFELMTKQEVLDMYEKALKKDEKHGDLIESVYKLAEDHFVGGLVYGEKVNKEDLANIPLDVMKDIQLMIQGRLEKKT